MNAASSTPIRDPRYAARAYAIDHRPDGGLVITNDAPFFKEFTTTNAALDYWARTAPDRVWLAERSGAGWRRLTFGEAGEAIATLAGALADLGLGPGKPLLILARNSIDHALISYAAMRLGAPVAPVSPRYGQRGADLSRLVHAVALIGPAAVYVADAAEAVEALDSPALRGVVVIAGKSARPGDRLFANLLGEGYPLPDQARPDQVAKLMLTSGSTGRPKAVICTHHNIAFNAAQSAACFDDPESPVAVNAAPWNHSLGGNAVLHTLLHRGGALHIDAGQPVPGRFGETLRNLREVSTTYHIMVPAGWALLADELDRDAALARVFFRRVRILQYGGAGLSQNLCDRVQAVALRTVGEQITFGAGYGSTETGPTACNVHWTNLRAAMIGLPLPGTSIKLVPQDGKFEICVRGPQVSPGYFDAQAAAGEVKALPLDQDGYCRMGDAAKLIDPAQPQMGLAFDGRLAENFKLATGAFVNAGGLRLAALSALGGAVLDAVVCGEGRQGVGLMLFVDPTQRERLGEGGLRDQIRSGLGRLNAVAAGLGGNIARALILDDLPDADSGELTDKGYINQALARSRRAAQIDRLFAELADPGVIVPDGR